MKFISHIPFVELLGFELLSIGGGNAEIGWSPRHEHMNMFEVTHGGAVMSLLDVTMAHAAHSADPETGAVTIEMKTSFMQPAKGRLLARGNLLHRTRKMAFVEGRVMDADGNVCAHATGTFRFVPRGANATVAAEPESSADRSAPSTPAA